MAMILIFIPASFSSPTPHEGCNIASERPDSAFAALAAGLEPAAGCHQLMEEEDKKPSDVVRGAQNNVSVFERQTSQMGAASSAAGDGWFKMIKQQVLQNAA